MKRVGGRTSEQETTHESVEQIRRILARDIIPSVQRGGISSVYLPQDLDPRNALPPGAMVPRQKRHRTLEMYCFLGESTPLWVEGRLYEFRCGDTLLLPPNIKHSHPLRGREVLIARRLREPMGLQVCPLTLGATGRLFEMVRDTLRVGPWCTFADPRIPEVWDALMEELSQRPKGYRTIAQALLLEMLGRIERAQSVIGLQAVQRDSGSASYQPALDLVSAAREYMLRHYHERLTLARIARYLSVSPYHLSRKFKQITGENLTTYLTNIRIDAAKRLLQTPVPIHVVAHLAGFASTSYFDRMFRRMTGRSPTQFRSRPSQ